MKLTYFFAFLLIFISSTLYSGFAGAMLSTEKQESTAIAPKVIWKRKVDLGSIVVNEHYVLVKSGGKITVLNADNGEKILENDSFDALSVKIRGDTIYALNISGIGAYGIDGKMKWFVFSPYGIWDDFVFSPKGIIAWIEYSGHLSLINYSGKIVMEKNWKSCYVISPPPVFWNNTITVYLYNSSSHSSCLSAIDLTGKRLWSIDLGSLGCVRDIEVDDNGMVYVLSFTKNYKYYVLESIKKGKVVWNITGNNYGVASDGFFRIVNSTIFLLILSQRHINIQFMDCADGTRKWETNITQAVSPLPLSGKDIKIDKNQNIYLVSYDNGNLYSYSPNGTLNWNLSLGHSIGEFEVQNTTIYALTTHDNPYSNYIYLYALGYENIEHLKKENFLMQNLPILVIGVILSIIIVALVVVWIRRKKENS